MTGFNWKQEEEQMKNTNRDPVTGRTGYGNWAEKYYNSDQSRKSFRMKNLQYQNKYGQNQFDDWFIFDYEVGHRLNSEEKRCYQGTFMPPGNPTCKIKCTGRECFLKGPAAPNTGKRLLVGSDGRPDTSKPTPG